MKKITRLLAALVVLSAGTLAQNSDLRSLVEAERAFSKTSEAKGTREAFLSFIADDGVLFRPRAVAGKKWLLESPASEALLTWRPIFADISRSGDLGYTTGPWEIRRNGPADSPAAYGNFVTVWKRQADNAWKFVIDLGVRNPAPAIKLNELTTPASSSDAQAMSRMKSNIEAERAALLSLDREFSKASAEKGAVDAFLAYLADTARVFRNDEQPAVNRQAAESLLKQKPGAFSWHPLGGDVARAADLGYTYGTAELKPASGASQVEYGNYLRIWKRQPGGKWKVVLDVLSPAPPPAQQVQ